jgi:hypothetical protein
MSASAPQTATYSNRFGNERLAAAAIWERMLEPIPTLLGKLVSAASFRDGVTAEYHHPALNRILSAETACRVLRESHEHLFAEWVGLFLDEQRDDMRRYISTLRNEGARDLLLKARESLIPPSANAAVRRAFLNDLEEILAAGPVSAASVPRFRDFLQQVA